MPQMTTGQKFGEAVCKAMGIDPRTVIRVMVEASATDPLKVYIEYVGTDALEALNLTDLMEGAVLTIPESKEK